MSTTEQNIDIVRSYFNAVGRGDLPAIGKLFSDHIEWHQPGGSRLSGLHSGKDAVFSLLGQFMERSAGTFQIDSIGTLMAQGDLVAASVHFRADRPDGRTMSMTGIDLLRVENGQIREVWLFSEDQSAEDAFWS